VVTSYLKTVRRFNGTIRLYLFATALMGFTYDGGIYAVIFNLYLLRLGYGPDFVGQVNAAGMFAFAVSAFPAGALGERFGNRRLLLVGMWTLFVGSFLLALVESGPLAWQTIGLMGAYILLNIGLACYFVNSIPYLMNITTAEERTAAFSVQSASISLAAFAGSLIAGFLPGYFALLFGHSLDEPAPYRYPLWLASILFTAGIWAIVAGRPSAAQPATSQPVTVELPATSSRSVWGLIGALTLIRLLLISGSAVAMIFFNVYMDAGLAVPTAQIGVAISLGRLSAVPAALLTPLLAARMGNARVTVLSSLGVVLCLLPLALAPVWYAATIGYIGAIAMSSVRYPAFMVYTMELIPARFRSVVAGASEMAAGLSFAMLALAGGFIIVAGGYGPLFLTGAAFNLLGTAALVLFLYIRHRQHSG
jgi:MFS family permease